MDKDFKEKARKLNDTPDYSEDFNSKDINSNKLMAILAYCSWAVMAPLFGAKKSRFAQFHANQGLILVILETVWWVLEGILGKLFWFLGWIMGLGNVIFVILIVIGIVNVANGRAKELPVIGKFRLINW